MRVPSLPREHRQPAVAAVLGALVALLILALVAGGGTASAGDDLRLDAEDRLAEVDLEGVVADVPASDEPTPVEPAAEAETSDAPGTGERASDAKGGKGEKGEKGAGRGGDGPRGKAKGRDR
ncbi:MAG: hypothetical protein ACLGIR_13895 [Actinomycetes bacterium]